MRKMWWVSCAVVAFAATGLAEPAPPVQEDESEEAFPSGDELDVGPSLAGHDPAAFANAERLMAKGFARWEVRWDERSNRPHLIQGGGFPLLPGKGNRIAAADLGFASANALELKDVEPLLRQFIADYPDIFRLPKGTLKLDTERSVKLRKGRVWFVEFKQYRGGVPVEGANVFFRINNGNIIQFGTDRLADVTVSTKPTVTSAEALDHLAESLKWDRAGLRQKQAAVLKLFPALPEGAPRAERFAGKAGEGYRHVLAWEFTLQRKGIDTTYTAVVDAGDGHVIRVEDQTRTATVKGGIYPTTNSDAEVIQNFPFTAVSPGAITDGAGVYNYPGGTVTSTLNGQYVQIQDGCGAISLSNSTNGELNFGSSGGTDCTTPGVGGAGNTHAARNAFFHLTNANRKAASFLPSNAWLGTKVLVNTNVNQTCNAIWNGTSINMFRSGGGCSNTGEIAAVLLHEWAHGLDTNTGGAAPGEQASGEAVGDTFAFLHTRDACIGQNFVPGQNCDNCTSCTGVRDVGDFSVSGGATGTKIAKPSNITANNGIDCDRFSCPATGFRGPMGYEGHCESLIASSANWDLTQKFIAQYGTTAGWSAMESLWYESLTPSKSAYRVTSGGTCNAAASVDGCAATNWYTVYLAADDDNGNLSDGTPNGCRIWDAFNDHGIACGAKPVCSVNAPTATPTATHTPTPTPPGPTATWTPTPTPAPGGTTLCRKPGVNIPDANATGVTDVMSVGTTGTLTDLDLRLDIHHTWVGDVTATLSHAGVTISVLDRPGVPGSTYGCSGNDIDVTLNDEAAIPVEGICAGTSPTIDGTFRPNNLLSAFDGKALNGSWSLNVKDSVGSDTGQLWSWCLVPTTGAPVATATPTAIPRITSTPTPTVPPRVTATPTLTPTATPTPTSCGGTSVTGSLSFGGDTDYWPGSAGAARGAGLHIGVLDGPAGPDFDLYLQKLNGASWQNAAQSIGSTSDETISHTNTAGTFRWKITSWSGSGNYQFCSSEP